MEPLAPELEAAICDRWIHHYLVIGEVDLFTNADYNRRLRQKQDALQQACAERGCMNDRTALSDCLHASVWALRAANIGKRFAKSGWTLRTCSRIKRTGSTPGLIKRRAV